MKVSFVAVVWSLKFFFYPLKAAVLALVEVYAAIGSVALPLLATRLSPANMKLLTIYIGRRPIGLPQPP